MYASTCFHIRLLTLRLYIVVVQPIFISIYFQKKIVVYLAAPKYSQKPYIYCLSMGASVYTILCIQVAVNPSVFSSDEFTTTSYTHQEAE